MSSTHDHPKLAELLQHLIRFNTTNPPGNEVACISYINTLLTEAAFQTTILARDPARPNLITRLAGQGNAPPLLLQGHVDVVTTENQVWQHSPFEGELVDGYIWGRGALDMKGGIAMMLAALLRAKAEGSSLPGDIVLAILSDEETGGDYGAKYLVEEHAGLFEGILYAIGEFGGFTLHIGGRRFYPITVAEKQSCLVEITVHGPGGHGSLPVRSGAIAKLGRLLQQLDKYRLPVHITPVAQQMLETISSTVPTLIGSALHQLLDPTLTDSVLGRFGPQGQFFDAILHNTVNVTMVHGSDAINVIPSKVVIELDGRLLPGYSPAVMKAELCQIIGDDVEIDVYPGEPASDEPNMGLFDTLADILREADTDGIPVPLLFPASTDGRFFARLGIQTYGFLPMKLPEGFNFSQTIHAADERISVEALDFGANAMYKALQRFGRK